jgi:hypothetical protein
MIMTQSTRATDRLLGDGVDIHALVERLIIAAESGLEEMDVFDPYDHHRACDLALGRAQRIVDLHGLGNTIRLIATPEPLRRMTIQIELRENP